MNAKVYVYGFVFHQHEVITDVKNSQIDRMDGWTIKTDNRQPDPIFSI
jgi:hypothetical protein